MRTHSTLRTAHGRLFALAVEAVLEAEAQARGGEAGGERQEARGRRQVEHVPRRWRTMA